MSERSYLTAVPAFYATSGATRVPFIVSVLLVDEHRRPRLTPAVERSINSTIDVTGRVGLATAVITDTDAISQKSLRYLKQAAGLTDAILLFLCQSGETAEKVMQAINTTYAISLVRREQIHPAVN